MPRIAGQLRPQTTRQQAFGQSIDQLGQSFGNLLGDMQTERQKAFNQAMRMREQGYDVSPEQVQEAQNIFTGGEGSMQKLFENRTQEYMDQKKLENLEAKRQRKIEEWNRKFKKEKEVFDRQHDKDKLAWEKEKYGLDAQKKQQEKDLLLASKSEKEKRELGVDVGGGQISIARTRKEAQELRDAIKEGKDAVDIIDQMKSLGTDVAVWDRGRINKINGLKNILTGKLRTAILGPGTMQQAEFERLIDTMGDPSSMFGLESIEHGKLDQLKNTLLSGLESAKASKLIDYKGKASKQGAGTMLSGSEMNIPYAPTNQPELMPEAMAGQDMQMEAIIQPERMEMRRAEIKRLRAKKEKGVAK